MQNSSASGDLVVCHYHAFDNRWKHTPASHEDNLVKYDDASVRFWDEDLLLPARFSNVRRLKMCRLPNHQPTPLDSLFHSLNAKLLEHLEFDQLVLLMGEERTIHLKSLQVLSVGSVAIVQRNGSSCEPVTLTEKPPASDDFPDSEDEFSVSKRRKNAFHKYRNPVEYENIVYVLNSHIKLSAPKLFAVYLASNSVYHIKFEEPKSITTLEIEYPLYEDLIEEDRVNLLQYDGLRILELNQVQNFNMEHVLAIIRGGRLKQLFCNIKRLITTLYVPTECEYKELERIFLTLQSEMKLGRISPKLDIFLHQVLLDPNRPFSGYDFQKQLADLYFLNWSESSPDGRTVLTECTSVVEVDYVALQEYLPYLSVNDLRLKMLHVGYPNIQTVYVDNSLSKLTGPNVAGRFSSFLQGCKALTELVLKNAKFKQTFYDDLPYLESMRYLNTLAVFEAIGFESRIDFRFLQRFEYLRRFGTNLANKKETLDILNRIRINCEYSFNYQQGRQIPRNLLVARSICSNGRLQGAQLFLVRKSNFFETDPGDTNRGNYWTADKLPSVLLGHDYQRFFKHWIRD